MMRRCRGKEKNLPYPNHHINKTLVYTNQAAELLFLDGEDSFTLK